MLVKVIRSHRDIVAVCDSDIIGRKFEQGKFQLHVKENFFKGEEMAEQEVLKILKKMSKEDATFNIVGKESTQTALKAGIITRQGIKKIQGVPFALVLL